MRLSHSLVSRVSRECLWALVHDVEGWPGFLPTMTHIEIQGGGQLRPGSRVLIKQPLQPAQVWTVERLDQPAMLRWRTGGRWFALTATHHLESCAEGTRQTLTLDLEGQLALPVAVLWGWLLQLVLWYENQCFRKRAERAGVSSFPGSAA